MSFFILTRQEQKIFFVSVILALLFFIPVYYFIGEKALSPGGADSSDYHTLANNFLRYGVFSMKTAPPYTPSVRAMPGYPFLLALSKYFFGNSIAIILLQILAFSGTAVLVFKIAHIFFGNNRWVILPVVFLFVEFYALFMALTVMTDTFFTFFLTFSFFLFFDFLRRNDYYTFLFSCCFLGIASLFRPAGTGIFLIYTVFYFLQTRRGLPVMPLKRQFAFLLAGALLFLLFVAPWSLRNYTHFGTFRFAANDAYTMYLLPAKRVQALADGVPFYVSLSRQRHEFAERIERESGCTEFESWDTFKCVGWLQQQSFAIFKKHPIRLFQTIALGSFTYLTYAEWSNAWTRWKILPSYPPTLSTPLREIFYHPSWRQIQEQLRVRWRCGFSCVLTPALLLGGRIFWILTVLLACFGVRMFWDNKELRIHLFCAVTLILYFVLLHGFLLSSIDIAERTRLPIFSLLFTLAAGGVMYAANFVRHHSASRFLVTDKYGKDNV